MKARDALQLLVEGNRRFVAHLNGGEPVGGRIRPEDAAALQRPQAIVLGCSDSRVPAESVFDQGLGDLYVIRVAGNIVAPSQVGSVEFAAEKFGTRLVVVMGHTGCGAIQATLDTMKGPTPTGASWRNLRSIVDRVRPSVEPLMSTELARDHAALIREATRANVRVSADHLRHGSQILEQFTLDDRLVVVGAE